MSFTPGNEGETIEPSITVHVPEEDEYTPVISQVGSDAPKETGSEDNQSVQSSEEASHEAQDDGTPKQKRKRNSKDARIDHLVQEKNYAFDIARAEREKAQYFEEKYIRQREMNRTLADNHTQVSEAAIVNTIKDLNNRIKQARLDDDIDTTIALENEREDRKILLDRIRRGEFNQANDFDAPPPPPVNYPQSPYGPNADPQAQFQNQFESLPDDLQEWVKENYNFLSNPDLNAMFQQLEREMPAKYAAMNRSDEVYSRQFYDDIKNTIQNWYGINNEPQAKPETRQPQAPSTQRSAPRVAPVSRGNPGSMSGGNNVQAKLQHIINQMSPRVRDIALTLPDNSKPNGGTAQDRLLKHAKAMLRTQSAYSGE